MVVGCGVDMDMDCGVDYRGRGLLPFLLPVHILPSLQTLLNHCLHHHLLDHISMQEDQVRRGEKCMYASTSTYTFKITIIIMTYEAA
jgi:hypothetical protein